MRALFDVNVLIALLDAGHFSHRKAMDWLEKSSQYGWASCPITQYGCLRIISNPKYPAPLPAAVVAERLGQAVAHWSMCFGLMISVCWDHTAFQGYEFCPIIPQYSNNHPVD